MSAIGPGDLVECVATVGEEAIKVGSVYTVEAAEGPWPGVVCDCHGKEAPGLLLVGIPTLPWWWCAYQFRPAGRRDESLIKDLLRPTEQPVRELESA